MSSVDDIVVVGRVHRDGSGGTSTYIPTYQYTTSGYRLNADYGDNWADWKDTSEYASAVVNVEVSDSSHTDAATKAAENVARALAEIEAKLGSLAPDTKVNWNGYTMTASQVLNILNTTKFVVTDQADFDNGGVGSANAELHTDYLNYRAFDGVVEAGETGDYASSTYQNDAGLIGILLHEFGHLSPAGVAFHEDSIGLFKEETGAYDGYYGSAYARNEERFDNDFSRAAGSSFGFDLSGVNLYPGYGAIDPQTIYDVHTGDISTN